MKRLWLLLLAIACALVALVPTALDGTSPPDHVTRDGGYGNRGADRSLPAIGPPGAEPSQLRTREAPGTAHVVGLQSSRLDGDGPWTRELPLEKGHVLRGTVHAPGGSPVPEVMIEVTAMFRHHRHGSLREALFQTRTGPDGSFELGGLPADVADVRVEGTGPWGSWGLRGPAAQAEVLADSPLIVTLPPRRSLELDIVHLSGEPVGSGRVVLLPPDGDGDPIVTRIREPGVARFEDLRHDAYEVVGFGPWRPDPEDAEPGDTWALPRGFMVRTTGPGAPPCRIRVRDACRVDGTVVGAPNGSAVEVRIVLLDGAPYEEVHSTQLLRPNVDPETGAFATYLPPGSYIAEARVLSPIRDSTPEAAFEVDGDPVGLALTFSDVNRIHGRVLDQRTNRPFVTAQVSLVRLLENGEPIPLTSALSDDEGGFEFRGLQSATYRIAALAEDLVAPLGPPIRIDGRTTPPPVRVELEPGGSLTVRSGQPSEELQNLRHVVVQGAHFIEQELTVSPGHSGSVGPLPAGPCEVIQRLSAKPTLEAAGPSWSVLVPHQVNIAAGQETTIELEAPAAPAATLAGHLVHHLHGTPLARVELWLEREGAVLGFTSTDNKGRFELASMTPGPAQLRVAGARRGVVVSVVRGHQDLGDVPLSTPE